MKYNLELIRLIAVLLITLTHTRHGDGTEWPRSFLFLVEELPLIGTIILSIISGYLYQKISIRRKDLFQNKVKTLLIPFVIANVSLVFLALLLYQIFDFSILNRLTFGKDLIWQGILALHSPPINPPTYFIRDIFVVFVMIELVVSRKYSMLLILIPLAVFGELMLRYDILVLFLFGVVIARWESEVIRYQMPILLFLLIISILACSFLPIHQFRYPVALLVFLLLFHAKIQFYEVGAFAYLLHLYHAPIMVAAFPLIEPLDLPHEALSILLQLSIAYILCLMLWLLTRHVRPLRILCGFK